jgi:hypothetical protein
MHRRRPSARRPWLLALVDVPVGVDIAGGLNRRVAEQLLNGLEANLQALCADCNLSKGAA